MKIIVVFVLWTLSLSAQAGDNNYAASAIPENLKTGMYAVVREHTVTFDVFSLDKSSITYHRVVTILNKNGDFMAQLAIGYDKQTSIDYFHGFAYDANGIQIKKLKQSDIYDKSSISSGTLFDDDRVKIADLSQSAYPYTVEFEYKIDYKFLFFYPDLDLNEDDEVSTEKRDFSLRYPVSLKPRIRANKVEAPRVQTLADGREMMSWSVRNVRPEKFEADSPDHRFLLPYVSIAPTNFSYGGHIGSMSSWDEYGKWQVELNRGRDVLPDKTVEAIKKLTAPLKTNEEKIRAVYEYMQGRTRYVGIQLGIGGFQPFDAKTVDELGYGDCKALSNYTIALLRAAGLKGYYVIIHGGPDRVPVIPDFVDNYFNHVVAAVPNGADTVWLECTSQTNPYGFAGTFTGERKALMITDTGGKLVNTPRYPDAGNKITRVADVSVEETGDATAKVKATYEGLMYDHDNLSFYLGFSADDQKKWLQKTIKIPSFDIESFSFVNKKAVHPAGIVNTNLILRRYATVNGKRLFLTPNLQNRSSYVPDKNLARKNEIYIPTGYVTFDSIRFKVPEKLSPEFLPEPTKISTRFGDYESSFKMDQGSVLYTRRLLIHRGTFPAATYGEWSDFYKNINKADNFKLVFLNKT